MSPLPDRCPTPVVRLRRARVATLLAACLGLAACAATGTAGAPPPTSGVAGAWRIEQAQREPIVDRRQARLDFGPDGRFGGHTSCNTMRSTYSLDGTRLKVGPVVTTRMACARLQLEQEDRILTALEQAVDARVRPDGLLELRDADGRGVLRGTRLEAGTAP